MIDREQLHREGYALLRQAIPLEWLAGLRAVFDANLKPPEQWPVPRGMDWRHAQLEFTDESTAVQLAGAAGDTLVFDVHLVHAGSRNASGARRRSILISYCAQTLQATHLETADLRGVRMDTREQFDPAQFRQVRP